MRQRRAPRDLAPCPAGGRPRTGCGRTLGTQKRRSQGRLSRPHAAHRHAWRPRTKRERVAGTKLRQVVAIRLHRFHHRHGGRTARSRNARVWHREVHREARSGQTVSIRAMAQRAAKAATRAHRSRDHRSRDVRTVRRRVGGPPARPPQTALMITPDGRVVIACKRSF